MGRSRPVGGFVTCLFCLACASAVDVAEAADPRLREVSAEWGLAFRHHHAGSGQYFMIETMGSGVVLFDYDDDGDEDVFFVDGAVLPGYQGEPPRSLLLRNDSRGGGTRFTDVTSDAGLAVTVYGMGAVAGDIDGDGDMDLYVTGFGPNQLFVNQGDGTFEEDTARAGVGEARLSAGAALADVDRDGDLDLYVANYVDFSFENNPICGNEKKGIRTYCHPDSFNGVGDTFYRNRGDGTFEEATAAVGFGVAPGNGLGAIFGDIDGNGWPDLYVANDMTPNFVFENKGGGRFEELALLAGVALNGRGNPEASMGVDLGDLDGDGLAEIIATHMDVQTNALYGYIGSWLFVDKRFASKLAEPSVGKVGFGVAFLDLDQDGPLDVAVVNGHIIDNIELLQSRYSFRQRNQVFHNLGKGVFREAEGAGLDVVRSSRGLAVGDLDGDGDLDLVVNNSNDLAEVYENITDGGRAFGVDLRQRRGNRYAIGAEIEARVGEQTLRRELRIGASYLSQHALTVHFGMGEAATIDALRIVWPTDGRVTEIRGLPTDVRVRVVRGAGDP